MSFDDYLYLALVAFIALIVHMKFRNYATCTIGVACGCAMVYVALILCMAIQAGKHVNLGFAPILFEIEMAIALPVTAVIGLPFLYFRRAKHR